MIMTILVVPFVCVAVTGAGDNIHPPWGYDQVNIGPLAHWEFKLDKMEAIVPIHVYDDPIGEVGNLAYVGQFGSDNQVMLWQVGFDELARVIQGGLSNLVYSVQRGFNHQMFIGQLGFENSAFTWQEKNATAIILIQLGDQQSVGVWPGEGLRVSVIQLGN